MPDEPPAPEEPLAAPCATQTPARRSVRVNPGAMSPTGLLSLMFAGPRAESAARALIRRHGLAGLRERSVRDLVRDDRLGRSHALRCVALFELARRIYRAESAEPRLRLTRPADVARAAQDLVRLKKEHLVGFYLDAQNHLVHRETLSMGSLNTTRTHPREILGPAIQHFAHGIILAHNHPSGLADPSDEDVEFTRAAARAAEIMGIEIYDHIIVASAGHVSLRERGLL